MELTQVTHFRWIPWIARGQIANLLLSDSSSIGHFARFASGTRLPAKSVGHFVGGTVDKTNKMEEGAAPAEGAPPGEGTAATDDKKIVHTYPLVKTCDMPEEMWNEVMELVVTGCEKFSFNYELASKLIKQGLDQRFGPPWNIVVGEAYGYEITYLLGSLMFMYTGGNIACICWKAPQL